MASIEHQQRHNDRAIAGYFHRGYQPDTLKVASYWGHMAETLTDSSGVAYNVRCWRASSALRPAKTLTIANGYDKGETQYDNRR